MSAMSSSAIFSAAWSRFVRCAASGVERAAFMALSKAGLLYRA
jgi:hypothetical protein